MGTGGKAMTTRDRIEQAIEQIDALDGPVDREGGLDREKLRQILSSLVEPQHMQMIRDLEAAKQEGCQDALRDLLQLIDGLVAVPTPQTRDKA